MLPADFSYVEFKPKRHATRREDLEKAYEVRVAVRSIEVGGAIRVEPPKALGTTLVEEWRLVTPPGAGPIVYASTNQRLPSAPEPSAVQIQRSYKAIALSQTKEAKPAKRLLILVLFLLSSASMLVLILRSLRRPSQSTNETPSTIHRIDQAQ